MLLHHRTGLRSHRRKSNLLVTAPLARDNLCIHQVCVWKQSTFSESLECFARHGIYRTALWKPLVDDAGLKQAKKQLADSGLTAVSMCPLVLLDSDKSTSTVSREKQHLRFCLLYTSDAADE